MDAKITLRPTLCKHCIHILTAVINHGQKADVFIKEYFRRHKEAGSKDRKFVAELVYFLIRKHFLIEAIFQKLEIQSDHWLRLQLGLFLKYPNTEFLGVEKEFTLTINQLNHIKIEKERIVIFTHDFHYIDYVLSPWMTEKIQSTHSGNWSNILSSLDNKANIGIRINTRKANADKIKHDLDYRNISYKEAPFNPHALNIQSPYNFRNEKLYQNGSIEIQDIGSQYLINLLDIHESDYCIDACAGAGGKSLQIAELLSTRGKLICMDIHHPKLIELNKRMNRSGIKSVQTQVLEGNNIPNKYRNIADKLLLDVPCSGIGVLRRNPDTKILLTKEKLEQYKSMQKQILSDYVTMVKIGGTVLYCTCSLFAEENEDQIQWFMQSKIGENFQLLEQKYILPNDFDCDGFFVAKLKRIS